LELQNDIGLSRLILYPDNKGKNLIEYYKNTYDFKELRENVAVDNKKAKIEKWLFLPLKVK